MRPGQSFAPTQTLFVWHQLLSLINNCCKTWLLRSAHSDGAWRHQHAEPDRTITRNCVTEGFCWHSEEQSLDLKANKDHNAPFRISLLLVPKSFAFLCSLELMLQFQQLLIQLVHALRQLLHLPSMALGYCTLMITQNGHLHKCYWIDIRLY